MINLNYKKKGFTMIEIVVVLLVVSIGIVGVMSLIVQNIQTQSYDKNTLISSQLAQEGIELIRKVRDSNWKTSLSFGTGLVGTMGTKYDYYMDYLDSVPHIYSGNSSNLILKIDSSGFYRNGPLTSASNSIFSRLISITELDDHTLLVDSTVTWTDHGHNYSYNLETLLYDWK